LNPPEFADSGTDSGTGSGAESGTSPVGSAYSTTDYDARRRVRLQIFYFFWNSAPSNQQVAGHARVALRRATGLTVGRTNPM
jgi:hypothetical protein